jgi:MFS family permease
VVAIILSKKTVALALARIAAESGPVPEPETPAEEEPTAFMDRIRYYIRNIPLKDARFMFFIFILIPVQTLFAHNWLTLPQYFSRAFTGVVSDNFEFFVNFNPILIFILTPVITALTVKKDTYTMMIIGTFVMSAPTFFLALGPTLLNVFAYLIIMTIGEAMWQPRFLAWIAEIAPKNMTGLYMGIGQFLVYDQIYHQSLFRLVPDELCTIRCPCRPAEYRNIVADLWLYCRDNAAGIIIGQRLDG